LLHGEKMSIEARAKILVQSLGVSLGELEKGSGISKQVWSNAFRGKQRMNSSHIEYLGATYPEYSYWLVTGDENAGLSPVNRDTYDYFIQKGEIYATAVSEYRYVQTILAFISDKSGIADLEQGGQASPLPSQRREWQEKALSDIGRRYSEAITYSPDGGKDGIDNFFRSLAMADLNEISTEYGSESREYLMCSRYFIELLIPGSTSNVF